MKAHELGITMRIPGERGLTDAMDRVDVSDFERGRRDPDVLTLLSYAHLTNVYLEVLVDYGLDLPEELPSPRKHEGIKRIEPDKKTNARSEALRSVTVTLRLEVKGTTKLARSANRARANIERYHLKGYGMRRLKEVGYELTLPCRNEANLKKRILLLLEDIENEDARDDWVVEAEYEGDEADHAKRGKSEEMEPLTSLCVWNELRKFLPKNVNAPLEMTWIDESRCPRPLTDMVNDRLLYQSDATKNATEKNPEPLLLWAFGERVLTGLW